MRPFPTVVQLLVGAAAVFGAAARLVAEPHIDWTQTAYADGRHNAFTDLVYWKGAYYLCFRHGSTHGSLDGEIRVLKSADMKTWLPCTTLDTAGDDRDPHFAATDDTLFVYFGTWDVRHMPGDKTPDRASVRSYCASTQDGASWTAIKGVYEPDYWLWRVRAHAGAFYSAAYTAVRPVPDARETRLLRSGDGLAWELIAVVTRERMAGEADMLWRPDGSVWLISRTGDTAGDAVLFTSDASMGEWTPQATGVRLHSPVFATWNDRVFVAGRDHQTSGSSTKVWRIENRQLHELLRLPSGGDTAYPGLIPDPEVPANTAAFYISWYSQHEYDTATAAGKHAANIYVGRVVLE